MNVDRNELEALDRESLVTRARNLGVERAEVLTRLEIIDEVLSLSIPDEQERKIARGLLGRARDLVARVVEKGLNLPDAALRLRTMAPPAAAWRRGPPPIATVALAEVYAGQGHTALALRVLDEVLEREPDHRYARELRERVANAAAPPPPPEQPSDPSPEPQPSPQRTAPVSTDPPRSTLSIEVAGSRASLVWKIRPKAYAHARWSEAEGRLTLRTVIAEGSWDGPRLLTDDTPIDALSGRIDGELPARAAGMCAAVGWLSDRGFHPLVSADWIASG